MVQLNHSLVDVASVAYGCTADMPAIMTSRVTKYMHHLRIVGGGACLATLPFIMPCHRVDGGFLAHDVQCEPVGHVDCQVRDSTLIIPSTRLSLPGVAVAEGFRGCMTDDSANVHFWGGRFAGARRHSRTAGAKQKYPTERNLRGDQQTVTI